MKKVLITGVTGQAGSVMSDFLLESTDNVIIGGIRRLSVDNHSNISHIKNNERFKLVDLDITDPVNTERVIQEEKPDYFINFAANSFVGNSWDMPINHMMTNAIPVMHQLEAIRKYAPDCRYFNAGSSEEFGNVDYSPQDINHPQKPRSPYGISKCTARNVVKVWRESYGLYAVQPFMFNYESERRGVEFVTRKITQNVARIYSEMSNGAVKPMELGNLDSKRDWSYCLDTIKGVWLMLNQSVPLEVLNDKDARYWKPKDYVLASGETHSIREFVELAFKEVGIKGEWVGKELQEEYQTEIKDLFGNKKITLVKINPDFYRPAEVSILHGDSTPARQELGWEPKTSFQELVRKMVKNDLT